MEIKRTQFALQICGSAHGGSIPPGHPTDGYAWRRGQRTVNPSHRNTAGSSPAPSTLRLRVREAYGATLLRWCAATHRRFKSFRKRFESEQIRLFNMTTFSSNIASYLLVHFHKNFFHFFIISNCFPLCNLVFDSFFMFPKLHSRYFR